MEHTQRDISAINYGNFMLDKWLEDEVRTMNFLWDSQPSRHSLWDTYETLVRFGEITKFDKLEDDERNRYLEMVAGWRDCSDFTLTKMAKCMMALEFLAEKRLKVTGGV